jgi:hypothetical protein
MSCTEPSRQLTDTMLEIGAKFFPRRYRRFKDLRPYQSAREWARPLNWRENPYDRYVLRREILHFAESSLVHDECRNVYTFASRSEIAAEVDRLLDGIPQNFEWDAFAWVLVALPWQLGIKYGLVRYSRLTEALAKGPLREEKRHVLPG